MNESDSSKRVLRVPLCPLNNEENYDNRFFFVPLYFFLSNSIFMIIIITPIIRLLPIVFSAVVCTHTRSY